MCGIIGYIGYRRPQDVLMEGLTRLEYRGYDSAGLAWRENGRIERLRTVGNLDSLRLALAADARARARKIGAVATGRDPHRGTEARARAASVTRAGPRMAGSRSRMLIRTRDGSGRIWIVLNGIIENYLELRRQLERGPGPVQHPTPTRRSSRTSSRSTTRVI